MSIAYNPWSSSGTTISESSSNSSVYPNESYQTLHQNHLKLKKNISINKKN